MAYANGELITAALLNSMLSRNTQQGFVGTNQQTSSTTYTDLATVGPSVTITSSGTVALVKWTAGMFSGDGTLRAGYVDFAISGATTRAPVDASALIETASNSGAGFRHMMEAYVAITPGTNTFTLKYRCLTGPFAFQNRLLIVVAP